MCRTTPSCTTMVESQMQPQRHKRVCFSEPTVVIEYVPARSTMSIDEQGTIWWHQDDIEEFCQNAIKNSTVAMKHKLLMNGLDRALQNSRQQHLLKIRKDDKTIDEYLQYIQEDRGLTLWCRFGHSRRGLERVCSRLHFESRSYAADKARAEVVQLSSKSSSSSSSSFSSESLADNAAATTTTAAEELRLVSERHSLFAKIFARMIAEADAIAATSVDQFCDTEEGGACAQSRRKQSRRNTQPSYSGCGADKNDVPPLIIIPTLLKHKSMRLLRHKSMRRWSA